LKRPKPRLPKNLSEYERIQISMDHLKAFMKANPNHHNFDLMTESLEKLKRERDKRKKPEKRK